ncbi:MAG: aminodeoxychorismate/anthranilate synthase component II [Planctomycetota bacterium]|nr:aminodeoxychorismate/anthranilate synthase component II [Planctomycetota bacterium]
MILLLDNYDSFTWNLWQALAGLGCEVEVQRNDALSVEQALARAPEAVVFSPGPGRPADAGIMPALLAALPARTPLLGVCLGHQCLVEHYGGQLEVDPVPVHGKASLVHHEKDALFAGLPNPFPAGRYHSLRAVRSSVPDCLTVTSWTEEGHVMGLRHRELPRHGVQFHPESILTPQGGRLLANFLELAGLLARNRA